MNRTTLEIRYLVFTALTGLIACATVVVWLYPMRNYVPLPNWIPLAPDWLVTIGTFPHGRAYTLVVFSLGFVLLMLNIDGARKAHDKLYPDPNLRELKPDEPEGENGGKPTST